MNKCLNVRVQALDNKTTFILFYQIVLYKGKQTTIAKLKKKNLDASL